MYVLNAFTLSIFRLGAAKVVKILRFSYMTPDIFLILPSDVSKDDLVRSY